MPVKLQKRDIKHHTCVLYECTSLYYASQLLNCSLIIFSWYFTCNKTEIWTSFKMSMSRMLPIKDFQENMHGKHLYQSSHRYQSSMDDMFKCPSVCVCVLMNTWGCLRASFSFMWLLYPQATQQEDTREKEAECKLMNGWKSISSLLCLFYA